MSRVLYKHLDREFSTEHKLFLLSVEKGGQAIRIMERNRVKDYQMSFELGGANWLCDIILKTVEFDGNDCFFRKFRGNLYVLLAMIDTNKRGSFFRIDELHEGKMSSIIVPNGIEKSGWRDLRRCLMSMLGGGKMVVKGRTDGKVWNGEKFQLNGSKGVQKSWNSAVVIYRSSSKETWEGIKEGLCRMLGRKVELSTLHANRAILWCRMKRRKEKCSDLNFVSCTMSNL